jgi:hypothetical protein
MNATIVILERLARENRILAAKEAKTGLEEMRLYYLGKAQAYEIAAETVRGA